LGYVTVDWTRPSRRATEWTAVDVHLKTCYERHWPLIVVFLGLHYCTVQIDADPMLRPLEEENGGLTIEEVAAVNALMRSYRREWWDSPVLRRYGRVPHDEAPTVARRMFELVVGELSSAAPGCDAQGDKMIVSIDRRQPQAAE